MKPSLEPNAPEPGEILVSETGDVVIGVPPAVAIVVIPDDGKAVSD